MQGNGCGNTPFAVPSDVAYGTANRELPFMTAVEKTVRLPHPELPGADWADCFEIIRRGRPLTAREAAEQSLSAFPLWIRILMRLRDGLVAPFGLKTTTSLNADNRVGFFPILAEDSSRIVLGLDDRHLDFRLVVETGIAEAHGQTIRLTTLVHRKARFGTIYLATITPFHRMIVASMLNRLEVKVA
jgi:hypothetical protein